MQRIGKYFIGIFVFIAFSCVASKVICQVGGENKPKVTRHLLLIITNPDGALLEVDGVDRWVTPARVNLETGRYVFYIKKKGYIDQKHVIEVDQTNTFAFDLKPQKKNPAHIKQKNVKKSKKITPKNKLYVNVVPSGSTIKIMNIIPKFHQGISLDPGVYKLQIRHKGYRTIRDSVKVKNQDLNLSYRLIKVPVPKKKTPYSGIKISKTPQSMPAVKPDTIPPNLSINPPEGESITGPMTTIAGKVTDSSGVAIVRVNGMDAVFDEDGQFKAKVLLKIGENRFVVEAVDVHRNKSETEIIVTRVKSRQDTQSTAKKDQSPPEIQLENVPAEKVATAVLSLRGYAKDASGVAIIRVNGMDAVLDEDGQFKAKVLLKIGENRFVVEAVDVHRNKSETEIIVTRVKSRQDTQSTAKKDQTPPEIQLGNVPEEEVTTSVLSLHGYAKDASGVAIVRVNGMDAVLDEDGQFEARILLKVGENRFTVEAVDVHRNKSETEIIVTRVKSRQDTQSTAKKDQSPPEIQLENVPEEEVTTAVLSLKGNAKDASGVAIVRVNGMDAVLDEDGQFEARILLKIGENRFTVEAVDVHRNRSEVDIIVTRVKSRQDTKSASKKDQSPPEIQLENVPEEEVTTAVLSLKGNAKDASGVAIVRVNGMDAVLDADGQFKARVLLKIGENPIVIEAFDILNNRASMKFSVVRVNRLQETPDSSQMDTTPPVINIIDSPQKPVKSAQIVIIGEVEDKSGVAFIKVNGRETVLSDKGYFKPTVLLKIGENRIQIEATDIFHNKSIKQITVKREVQKIEEPLEIQNDTDPPALTIDSLPEFPIKTALLTVTGRAVDPSGVAYVNVNGKKAALDADGHFKASVLLKPGNNVLWINALDIFANRAIQKFNVTRTGKVIKREHEISIQNSDKPGDVKNTLKYHGFIIGIDEYFIFDSLNSAVEDAFALEKVLGSQYGFQTTMLVNREATARGILGQLDKYQKKLNESDGLLIYFAGHVFYDFRTQEASWLPVDADPDGGQWLSFENVIRKIQKIPAKHILLIVNSFDKALSSNSNKFSFDQSSVSVEDAMTHRSRILIQCRNNRPFLLHEITGQPVFPKTHSVFNKALIKALTSIRENTYTTKTLFVDHIRKYVISNSGLIAEYTILKNSGHGGGDFVFTRKEN